MSTEVTGETTRIETLGRELGDAIAETEEYRAYEEARAAVAASATAQEMIDEFEELRREFVLARQRGEATQGDLDRVRRRQGELHRLPVMADYLEAQAALDGRLEAVNEAISEPLAVDFGEQAGGCCHD